MQSVILTQNPPPVGVRQRSDKDSLAWQSIYRQLNNQRDAIIDEIRSYPPPIPACDVQYNYLLEQRTRVLRELKQLSRIELDDNNALQEFVATSAFLTSI